MSEKINSAELKTKLFAFMEQYNKSEKLTKTFQKALENFAALFPEDIAYLGILRKAHLVEDNTLAIKIEPLEDVSTFKKALFLPAAACLPIFHERKYGQHTEKHLGLNPPSNINPVKEYCLLFDEIGEISLLAYRENRNLETFDFSNVFFTNNSFLLNFPLFLCSIMTNPELSEAKKFLEQLVEKNPISTLAHLYFATKNREKEILELPQKMLILGKIIASIVDKLSKNALIDLSKNSLNNSFTVKVAEASLPYNILEEAGETVIQMSLAPDKPYNNYSFKQYGEFFPALISFKAGELKPYFLSSQAFQTKLKGDLKKIPYSPFEINGNLLTLEEKVADFCKFDKNRLKTKVLSVTSSQTITFDPEWFGPANEKELSPQEKEIFWNLTNNVKLVFTTFKEYFDATSFSLDFIKKEKEILPLQGLIKRCEKTFDEITKTLALVYSFEILLKNL